MELGTSKQMIYSCRTDIYYSKYISMLRCFNFQQYVLNIFIATEMYQEHLVSCNLMVFCLWNTEY